MRVLLFGLAFIGARMVIIALSVLPIVLAVLLLGGCLDDAPPTAPRVDCDPLKVKNPKVTCPVVVR